ncbi:cytochrome P450 [Suillus tomentosus]|nr:cytochrome P450 [Suillus tomentosus]
MVFVLAMVLYPDVQKRAQPKVDSVVGKDRLPTFEDRASLPYINAVLRETFRWQPISPLGIPHATSSDDIYDGYFIPKKVQYVPHSFRDTDLIVGVLYGMKSGTPTHLVSYQRGSSTSMARRYTADTFVWSAIVTMLATLDISSVKDDQGKVISFTPTFITGLVR